jgi:hypothetical protein
LPSLKRTPDLDNQYTPNPAECADDSLQKPRSDNRGEPIPPDGSDYNDLEALLADLDLNPLAGTETVEEVIEAKTAEDRDAAPVGVSKKAQAIANQAAPRKALEEDDLQPASRKVLTFADAVSRKVPANTNERVSEKVVEEDFEESSRKLTPLSRKVRTSPRSSDEKDKQIIDRIREIDSLPPIYPPALSSEASVCEFLHAQSQCTFPRLQGLPKAENWPRFSRVGRRPAID